MGKTKIVGIAGKFGPRYGASLRKQYKEIMEKKNEPHICPFCGMSGGVMRVSIGLWTCRKCGTTWAGAAYLPRSGLNKAFPKVVVK